MPGAPASVVAVALTLGAAPGVRFTARVRSTALALGSVIANEAVALVVALVRVSIPEGVGAIVIAGVATLTTLVACAPTSVAAALLVRARTPKNAATLASAITAEIPAHRALDAGRARADASAPASA